MNFEAKIMGEIFLPLWIISSMFKMRGNRVSKIGEKTQIGDKRKKFFPSHFEYIRNNLSFKIHIGTCESVENCGFYIILSYPLAFLTKLEKGEFLGTLQNGQILLQPIFMFLS